MQRGVTNNVISVISDPNFPNQGGISLYLGLPLGVCHSKMLPQVGLALPLGGAKWALEDSVR